MSIGTENSAHALLAFYRGIPGSIGGALRMNAGAHGRETKDALVSARAVDRRGQVHDLSNADMGFTYRHSAAPEDAIFVSARSGEGLAGLEDQCLELIADATYVACRAAVLEFLHKRHRFVDAA